MKCAFKSVLTANYNLIEQREREETENKKSEEEESDVLLCSEESEMELVFCKLNENLI